MRRPMSPAPPAWCKATVTAPVELLERARPGDRAWVRRAGDMTVIYCDAGQCMLPRAMAAACLRLGDRMDDETSAVTERAWERQVREQAADGRIRW